jgi:undecaprenyl-diphosphatase
MLDYIVGRDHWLMNRVNSWHAPRAIRVWMMGATVGGDGYLWLAIALCVLLFGGAERLRAISSASLAAAVGTALFLVMKRAAGRRRPCAMSEHCWARLLPPDQFSFPSGHSITAFAVATTFGLVYPAIMPVLLLCAFSIAASRIVLGMHFLSDVVVGCAIGALLGYAAFALL